MSLIATTRVVVTLDPSSPAVKSLGDMRSMYAISQAILANSKGAALIRCGYTGEQDEYYVDLSNHTQTYDVDSLLTNKEQGEFGVKEIRVKQLVA